MLAIDIVLVFASFFPRVEDPWPDTISLSFPFAAAGIGGVLADAFFSRGSGAERDEVIRNGGLWGFWLGALFYALAFLGQITSVG